MTKELENANINQYDVPINPQKLQDFSKHYYGRYVPDDVNQIVEKDNAALAVEIENQYNQRVVNEIKSLYSKRWKEYKEEFANALNSKEIHKFRCLAQYLYATGEV